MDQHYGLIVEKVIRRNGYSISELARLSNVNRRSVYNWFNQKHLKSDIIYRIGCALNYDFSVEFPELFSKNEFKNIKKVNTHQETALEKQQNENSGEGIWKDKYISLLEKYNELLSKYLEEKELSAIEAEIKKL